MKKINYGEKIISVGLIIMFVIPGMLMLINIILNDDAILLISTLLFAKALTSAFVKHCIECDLIPHWDCVESNTGSIRLAESIGFEKIKERPFYWFDI